MPEQSATAAHLWPSPEQQLLLTAALSQGEESFAAFRAWRLRVDLMDEFHHDVTRLLPLVYDNLSRQGFADPIMPRLKGAYRRAWYDTKRLFHSVEPALAALVAAGVSVTLLKGAPLAVSYYGNAALRPMGDVDVHVSPADLDRTLTILRAHGWQIAEPQWDTLRFRHAVQCLGPNRAEIDLHWHVVYEAASDDADAELLATAEPVDFLGSPVRQLDPTGLLFLVIVHGVRWADETPIRWIPDAMRILELRGPDIDWQRLIAFATARRLTHRLALGLDYLVRYFAAPVPSTELAQLQARQISLLERVEKRMLLSENVTADPGLLQTQWLRLVEYLRYADSHAPWAFANGFTHYLRYRMDLTGRRELPSMLLRAIGKRVSRRRGATTSSSDIRAS